MSEQSDNEALGLTKPAHIDCTSSDGLVYSQVSQRVSPEAHAKAQDAAMQALADQAQELKMGYEPSLVGIHTEMTEARGTEAEHIDQLRAEVAKLQRELAAQTECANNARIIEAARQEEMQMRYALRAEVARLKEELAAANNRLATYKSDAENFGNALNDAGWEFIHACPEKSALLFNNCKTSLREAFRVYFAHIDAALGKQEESKP